VDLSHVVWIGGPQGSGKTSIAAVLADRFGWQLYNIDHRTWVHEARMPPTEFSSLSMDERWVSASTEQMLKWFVTQSRHRMRLILEDLRDLPAEPACIVEGPQLFPTSVSAVLREPDQALFLMTDLDEMRERLRARGPIKGATDGERARENAIERDVLIARTIGWEARDLRLAVLPVDRPLDAMIERAAEALAPVAERLPRGGDLAAVRALEAGVRATQIRLYEESLSGARGTSR
jgi:broad-specificity NMP kinase